MAARGEVGADVSQLMYSCRSLSTSGETCAVAAPKTAAVAAPASRVGSAHERPGCTPGSALLQSSHQHDGRCRLCRSRFRLDGDGGGAHRAVGWNGHLAHARAPVRLRLERDRRHRFPVLDEPQLICLSWPDRFEAVAVDDGMVLCPVPEQLDARLRIAGGRELEQLDTGIEDRIERVLALHELIARPAKRLRLACELSLERRQPTAGRHERGAKPQHEEQAGGERQPWTPWLLWLAEAGHQTGAQGWPRRRFAITEREQRSHLAILGHLALRIRRRCEKGFESPGLLG